MFSVLRQFFYDGQTFSSAAGDLVSLVAAVAASPAGQDYLASGLGHYGPLVTVAAAYLGGVVSGRKTMMGTKAAPVA